MQSALCAASTNVTGRGSLERVLRVLRDAYDSSPNGFDRRLIEGLGLVLAAYSVIEDELLLRGLATERHGFHGVHRRAEDYWERLGRKVPECVAAAVVDIYNSQTGKKGALVKWWKAHNGGRLRRARGVPFDG